MVAFNLSSQRGSFLALAAIVALIVSAPSSDACASSDCANNQPCCPSSIAERRDCGYGGITKEQCLHRNCCWDSSTSDPKIPWCYDQKARVDSCPTDKNVRTDCGYKGISKDECSERKCCWDDSTSDPKFPWCFNTQSTCTP